MSRRPPLQPGFSLMEMMVVISLLATFALLASRVFVSAMKLARQAEKTPAALARLDQAIAELRQDVWNSQSLSVPQPGRVVLRQAGAEVAWQYTPARGEAPATLVRTSHAAGSRPELAASHPLPGAQPAFTFLARPGGLIVELRLPGASSRRVALASQVQLAARAAPRSASGSASARGPVPAEVSR